MTTAPLDPAQAGQSGADIDPSLSAFLAAYPHYATTTRLDELRAVEYSHLDADGGIYLDYTGAGVCADAQLRAHTARLHNRCFGNPHSDSPASKATTELVEQTRRAVLEYFNASPDEYVAIFTPNATGACRLVAESYRFGARTRFVLTYDNHNSVNGIREFANMRGAVTQYVPVTAPDLRIDDASVRAALAQPRPGVTEAALRMVVSGSVPWAGHPRRRAAQRRIGRSWAEAGGQGALWRDPGSHSTHDRGLFAFPAQSNFTGVQHPLHWVDTAHEYGYDVLLDVAAYVATNRLDLSAVHPDFIPVSWYKVFGFPTGVGCLIARRDALVRLRRPWFSGGTIQAVSVQGGWHTLTEDESAFEDGTLNFLAIPDIEIGLSWINNIGIDLIHTRVACLTGWLLDRLVALCHSSGAPMVRIYGPTESRDRGGTIAFNLLDPDGNVVDERAVARDASAAGISLRTGCFCNPGVGEGAFHITKAAVTGSMRHSVRSLDDYLDMLKLPSAGSIRVSLGLASNIEDVDRLLQHLQTTYQDRFSDLSGLEPRLRC
ncbi:aminotransferase class V-fold PLP-dependent enzyme [Frankia sp. Cas4]|uniref:aminotransferase class V-fold PLP-dependent enzyme n=1 Tax=Frankia sp. Cas4 TaxID=3073927 RepID=UPI002AD5B18E|nr:aminotransferase class V-fold PLP-dependent enzyme [Frankia sp. Cas4]